MPDTEKTIGQAEEELEQRERIRQILAVITSDVNIDVSKYIGKFGLLKEAGFDKDIPEAVEAIEKLKELLKRMTSETKLAE